MPGTTPMTLTESDVERVALGWLEALGWRVAHGLAQDMMGE